MAKRVFLIVFDAIICSLRRKSSANVNFVALFILVSLPFFLIKNQLYSRHFLVSPSLKIQSFYTHGSAIVSRYLNPTNPPENSSSVIFPFSNA